VGVRRAVQDGLVDDDGLGGAEAGVAPLLAERAPVDGYAAVEGADAVAVLTEWKQYRGLDPVAVAARIGQAKVLDARNVLDAAAWRAAGFEYKGLGRP